MFKALFQKQILQLLSVFYKSTRTDKNRSKVVTAAYTLLMLYAALVIGYMFYMVSDSLCAPLVMAGLDWLYFAVLAVMAVILGVVGSIFMAQSQLFEAKDNELLLSMPVPPSMILAARMFTIFIQILVFEIPVLIPAAIVYAKNADISAAWVVQLAFVGILLTLLGHSLTCIAGWAAALVSSKVRHKNLMTIILSFALLGGYFFVYFRINTILQSILINSDKISTGMKKWLYPLYKIGYAACGDKKSLLIAAAIIIVFFAAIYFILSKTFIQIAAARTGAAKYVYKEKKMHAVSQEKALFKKEMLHFAGSPVYMLNCGLGAVMLIAGAVLAIIKKELITGMLAQISGAVGSFADTEGFIGIVTLAAISLACSMNVVTAPSISIEGKTMWNLQSLPVEAAKIFKSKIKLHTAVSLPAAAICAVVFGVIFEFGIGITALVIITAAAFIIFIAMLGICLNLKFPSLNWTSEVYAVKQSISVIASIFAGWAVIISFGVIYYLTYKNIEVRVFMLICFIILMLADIVLWHWVKNKGAKIFEEL